ncbi:MAG TPA: hypothetical protein VLF63_01035, partial [Patescibacteria group bacterium]|nr:hypothetical protein [Patescibacteria group bacterium]
KWNNVAKNKIWHVLLTGLLAMIVVPIAIVILFATVIGIPLAIILLLLWFISLILSGPLASYYTGHLVAKNIEKAPLIILIGTLVLGIIFLIPILGGIIILVATWFGIGTILLNLKKLYLKPDYSTKLK